MGKGGKKEKKEKALPEQPVAEEPVVEKEKEEEGDQILPLPEFSLFFLL